MLIFYPLFSENSLFWHFGVFDLFWDFFEILNSTAFCVIFLTLFGADFRPLFWSIFRTIFCTFPDRFFSADAVSFQKYFFIFETQKCFYFWLQNYFKKFFTVAAENFSNNNFYKKFQNFFLKLSPKFSSNNFFELSRNFSGNNFSRFGIFTF